MSGFRCQQAVFCVAVIFGASPLALAQDATSAEAPATIPVQEVTPAEPAPAAEKVQDGKATELNEVVVTARKRSESLQRVPVSVTAFSAKQMEQRGYTGLEDIASATPGFTFEGFATGGAHGNPVIRGLAQQFTTARVQNVSFFLDGVYLQRQSMLNVGLIDMERIEVVKGPQNALYGRSAFAGAVNYITLRPSAAPQGYVSMTLGDNDRREFRTSYSGPLNRTATLRGKFTYGTGSYDGHTKNHHPVADANPPGPNLRGNLGGHSDDIYSVSLAYLPTEALSFRIGYYNGQQIHEAAPSYSLSGVNAARFGLRFDAQNDLNCNTATAPDIQPQPPRTHTGFSLWCGPLPRYASDVAPRTMPGMIIDPRAIGTIAETQVVTFTTDYDFTDGISGHYLFGFADHSSYTDGGTSDEDPLAGRGINVNAALTQVDTQDPNAYEFINTASSRPNSILDTFSHELRFDWRILPTLNSSAGVYYSQVKDREWTALFINDLCNADTPENIQNCSEPLSAPNTLAERTVLTAAAAYDQYTRQHGGDIRGEDTAFRDRIYAGFASLRYNFTDTLEGTLEGRYTVESKVVDRFTDSFALAPGQSVCYGLNCTPAEGRTIYPTAPVVPAGNTLTSAIAVPHDTATFRSITPRAILNWNFAKRSMAYVSAAKGVKAGGFNNANTEAELTYEEEESWAYELGSKNTFFGRALTLNGAIYYVDQSTLQGGVPPSVAGLSTSDIITNIGGATNLGIELETVLAVSRSLSFDAGGTLSNPQYKKGTKYAAGVNVAGTVGDGAFRCDGVTCPADGDISGNQLSRSSRVQLTGGINFNRKVGGWGISSRFDTSYQSKQYLEPLNLGWVPARQLYNASLRLSSPQSTMELTAWVKNLTDEDYASNSFVIGVFNQYLVGKGARRTFGTNLKFSF